MTMMMMMMSNRLAFAIIAIALVCCYCPAAGRKLNNKVEDAVQVSTNELIDPHAHFRKYHSAM